MADGAVVRESELKQVEGWMADRTMRRRRCGSDALYELLVIEASHVDQIMSQLATTSPMA